MMPPASHMLDIRHNAIESVDDFLALVNRARERGLSVDTVIMTPEQHDALLASAAGKLGVFGSPLKTFYGYTIIQQEID